MSTAVIDRLAASPELVIVLAAVIRAAVAWQSELSWYEYRTAHGAKRLLFPSLEAILPGIIFVNEKGGRDDAEYLATVYAPVREVAADLRANGGTLHLLNSVKRRPTGHGDTLTRAHVVFLDGDEQTEAYLFANDDGSTDLYAHAEAAVTDPVAHLTAYQTDGDPDGVVTDALTME